MTTKEQLKKPFIDMLRNIEKGGDKVDRIKAARIEVECNNVLSILETLDFSADAIKAQMAVRMAKEQIVKIVEE